jgi:hypothetical protein
VTWPEKIKALSISVAGQPTASLLKGSVFQLVYEATAQRCVGLGLPPGGIETVDHTMALKLRRGARSGDKSPARSYPGRKELEKFGRDVCGVQTPSAVIEQLSDAMAQTLHLARCQASIPPALCQRMTVIWDTARRSL